MRPGRSRAVTRLTTVPQPGRSVGKRGGGRVREKASTNTLPTGPLLPARKRESLLQSVCSSGPAYVRRWVILPRFSEGAGGQIEAHFSALHLFDHIPIDPMVLAIFVFGQLDTILPFFVIHSAHCLPCR